jgi:hypothetical protein
MSNVDGIKWLASAHIDKYSPDQVAWATQRLGYNPKGFELEALFAQPEDGILDVQGNLITTAGLGNLTNLLIAGGGDGLTAAKTVLGVGSTATAAAVGDTALGANGTAGNGTVGCWYIAADSAPTRTTTTVTNDTVQVVGTFNTSASDFAWQEWGWAVQSGTGAITPSATLASTTAGTETLINHKIASMGTKAGGATWVLTTKVTFS